MQCFSERSITCSNKQLLCMHLNFVGTFSIWRFVLLVMNIRNGGGQLPLLPFARRGKGGRSALWVIKYYLINHISSDAFWAKSWGVILNVTWLSAFAFIGKSTHNYRFISSPESIEVPFGVRLPPLPFYRSGVPEYIRCHK